MPRHLPVRTTAGPVIADPRVHELSNHRKAGVLVICCTALLLVGIDITIVNVALPSIGRSLHSPVSGLQWTVDSYTLVMGSFLILSGSTADQVGRRRIFVLGMATFALGSLLCSLAPNLPSLAAFRMLQAVGGSMLNPVALSIVTNTFTDPRQRAQAIGIWGSVFGISIALGPVLGGVLVGSAGWRSIFWINVPVALVGIALTLRFVPESPARRVRSFDPVGQVLIVAFLAALTYGIIEAPSGGWTSPRIVTAFVVAGAALAGLGLYEPRRAEPLINLRFFRSPPFSGAVAISMAVAVSLGGFLFLNTLYLQDSHGLSALQAGLDTLPLALTAVACAPLSGRVVARRGPRLPALVVGIGLVSGGLVLTQVTATTPFAWLFAAYVALGIAIGTVNAPITTAAVSGMPRDQAGVAAGITSTVRQVGQTLGVAVLGAIVASSVNDHAAVDLAIAAHAGWWILVGCGVVVFGLSLASTSTRALAAGRRVIAELDPST